MISEAAAGGTPQLEHDHLARLHEAAVALSGISSLAEFGLVAIRQMELLLVFEEFEQACSGRDRPRDGTGLGLSLSRHLMELMGGSLDLERSEEGAGSTFALRLTRQGLPAGDSFGRPLRSLNDLTAIRPRREVRARCQRPRLRPPW